MEIKKVTAEMREQLRKPLPDEAVSKHPTKTYLSSIKAIYVFERLNSVFGIGSYIITSEEIDGNNGAPVVKVRLQIPEYGIDLSSYGGNDNGGANSKNYDLGDAYKGAATDAVTKICSWLEIGLSVFKGMGNKPMELTVDDAVAEYLKAENREQANNIWKKYRQFQKNETFIKAAKAIAALFPKEPEQPQQEVKWATEKQKEFISNMLNSHHISDEFKQKVQDIESNYEGNIPLEDAQQIIKDLEKQIADGIKFESTTPPTKEQIELIEIHLENAAFTPEEQEKGKARLAKGYNSIAQANKAIAQLEKAITDRSKALSNAS